MKEVRDLRLNQIPFRTKSSFKQNKDGCITTFVGNAVLSQGEVRERVRCKIQLKWFPNVRYTCSAQVNRLYKLGEAELEIDKASRKLRICRFSSNGSSNNNLVGYLYSDEDKFIVDEKITFNLINLQNYIGRTVTDPGKGISFNKDRLLIKNDIYYLLIDKVEEWSSIINQLNAEGGYRITNNCELSILDSNVSIPSVIGSIQFSVGFINGAWAGPLLLAQEINKRKIFFRDSHVTPYKYRRTIFHYSQNTEIEQIISSLSMRLIDDESQLFHSIIHTYIVCNDVSWITVGMAVTLIQTALERISEFQIVEKAKKLSYSKWDKMKGEDKISILLKEFGIPQDIPETLEGLHTIAEELSLSGPGIITSIRNPYIHQTKTNRKKMGKFSSQHRIQTWELAMWYFDLSILKMLDYDGRYLNRIDRKEYAETQAVPWNSKTG